MSSSTACPTESVFAELAAGDLKFDARRALEEHLDQCDVCTELVGILGALPSALNRQHRTVLGDGDATGQQHVPWWLTDRATIAFTLLVAQLFWSAMLWYPATKWLASVDYTAADWRLWGFAAYAAVVGILGPLIAVAAVLAVWRRRSWAVHLIAVQAAVTIPSLVLTPLAIVTVLHLRRQRHLRV